MRILLASILFLFFCNFALGALTEIDRQEIWSKNLIKNGGFEQGLGADGQKWTASAGALVLVTSGTNKLDGANSATWDASAAGQTLSYSLQVIPDGLKGVAGVALCKIKVPTGTATHILEAFDGTSAVGTGVTVNSSSSPLYTYVNFTFPASGSITLRLRAVAANEPFIAVDSCALSPTDETPIGKHTQARVFTSDSSWTVPAGVNWVRVVGCGGGGGGQGGGASGSNSGRGGAGGEGAPLGQALAAVTPGQVISVTLGVGGTAGAGATSSGANGGAGGAGTDSVFGATTPITFYHGAGGGQTTNLGLAPGGDLGGNTACNAGGVGPTAATNGKSSPTFAGGIAAPSNCSFPNATSGAGGGAGGLGIGGAGGACGGSNANGSAAPAVTAGNFCGGGGGGGGGGCPSLHNGGAGAAGAGGKILISWEGPSQ